MKKTSVNKKLEEKNRFRNKNNQQSAICDSDLKPARAVRKSRVHPKHPTVVGQQNADPLPLPQWANGANSFAIIVFCPDGAIV
jgi:hypothetical protein